MLLIDPNDFQATGQDKFKSIESKLKFIGMSRDLSLRFILKILNVSFKKQRLIFEYKILFL